MAMWNWFLKAMARCAVKLKSQHTFCDIIIPGRYKTRFKHRNPRLFWPHLIITQSEPTRNTALAHSHFWGEEMWFRHFQLIFTYPLIKIKPHDYKWVQAVTQSAGSNEVCSVPPFSAYRFIQPYSIFNSRHEKIVLFNTAEILHTVLILCIR